MNIGIFDSGLGGLFVTRAIHKSFPKHDLVYLGDTKRVPYGNRSHKAIYEFLEQGVEFLFRKNCQLIIVACNSASASALRKIQQEYLPKNYPTRKVLGVIIPTSEAAVKYSAGGPIGIIGTNATIKSGAYEREVKHLNRKTNLITLPTPLLVPIIEANNNKLLAATLQDYLKIFKKKRIKSLILGCTHYGIIKSKIQKIVGQNIKIVSTADIIPTKLSEYLKRHPEIDKKLTQKGRLKFYVTDLTNNFKHQANKWFGKSIKLNLIKID